MAFSISEKWESGGGAGGENASDTYIAVVKGLAADNADDPLAAFVYATQHFALYNQFGNILTTLDRERIAPYTWKFTAHYRSPSFVKPTGDGSFSFNTGGGTTHIAYGRGTQSATASMAYTGPAASKTMFDGAINVSGLDIGGVDIHVRGFDFKLTFHPPSMNSDYVNTLYQLTGRVNSDTVNVNVDGVVLSFAPGELLFIGAEGQKREGIYDWEVSLNFSAIFNDTNLTVGTTTGIQKKGWEYCWVWSQPVKDTANKFLRSQPQVIFVEQLYDYQALSPLISGSGYGSFNGQVPPWFAGTVAPPGISGGLPPI